MNSCIEVPNAHTRPEILVSESENERLNRVLALLPQSTNNILEIGARHGVMTERLAERCHDVTALDLQKPSFQIDHVTPIQGDVQQLQFSDNSFDCVVCTEVLEHLPNVSAGAHEIVRVARSHILIGVPYRQDRRVGRMTCGHCGWINPPYGHLNAFDEKGIERLFPGTRIASIEYVSTNRERTNSLSTWLQDIARNPYGAYGQEEPCIYCNRKLERLQRTSLLRRAAGALGARIYEMQFALNRPRATWMLVLFEKGPFWGKIRYEQGSSPAQFDQSQSGEARRFVAAPLYIVETIYTRTGEITTSRYPTLFYPEEVMTERTIRIFANAQRSFEKHDADYVLYHLEGYEDAGQWRISRPLPGETSPRAILEPGVGTLSSGQCPNGYGPGNRAA